MVIQCGPSSDCKCTSHLLMRGFHPSLMGDIMMFLILEEIAKHQLHAASIKPGDLHTCDGISQETCSHTSNPGATGHDNLHGLSTVSGKP